MADGWPNDPDSVLRGLWGNLVGAAQEPGGRSAVNMWDALHSGAEAWASSVLSITSPTVPTDAEIALQAQSLIGHVTIMDMNRYSSLVGQYLSAKQNLQTLQVGEQITGAAIFTPPWNTTADNPAIPTRYRIRVLRDITVRGFTHINRQEWSTYEITSPLTNLDDALSQANTLFAQADYNARADINAVLDYSIEAV